MAKSKSFERIEVKVAKAYLATKKASFQSVADKIGISSSTVGKYLNRNLKLIDADLWKKVQEKKAENIARARQNFVKPAPKKKTTTKK